MDTTNIVYVDLDDTLCDYCSAHLAAKNSKPEQAYPQSESGFFYNLTPITGGVEAFNKLLADTRYDPYILTAPSERNPLSYTEKRLWVEKHLGFQSVKRLIISPNKSLLKGAYLIDDMASGKGQEKFEGELIQFGTPTYKSWEDVSVYLGL